MTTFEGELDALRTIYDALKPFAMHERDRLLRMVQERLARERPTSAAMRFRHQPNPDALKEMRSP